MGLVGLSRSAGRPDAGPLRRSVRRREVAWDRAGSTKGSIGVTL